MNNKLTLSLDFDGVLHSYTSGWKGVDVIPDPPVVDRNGVSVIEKLYEYIEHFDVCIYSTRSESQAGIAAMQAWLGKWDDAHWQGKPNRPRTALVLCVRFPTTKPIAFVGIDDRVLTFDGKFPSVDALKTFQPWNKKAVTAVTEGERMADKLSASEALFMFMVWLTTLEEPVIFSARHEAGLAADLVGEFCKANDLKEPREGWSDLGVWPQTRKLFSGNDPIQPLAIQDP